MRMNDYTQKVQEDLASGEIVPSEQAPGGVSRAEEKKVVDQLSANISRAVEIEADLIERLADVKSVDLLPRALSAVSDARSKSIDGLLKLTGRTPDAPAQGLVEMLRSMADKGYLRMSVDLGPAPEKSDDAGTDR